MRAQAGDDEAFQWLFMHYAPKIYGYLRHLVDDRDLRDDLVQEIFEKVWRQFPSLKDASHFEHWLYAIARNAAFDYRRRQLKSKLRTFERNLLDEDNDTENSARFELSIEGVELVKQALLQLPLKQRQCLLMQLNGFPTSEIAQALEVQEQSVATYVSRGRRAFREAYNRLKPDQTRDEAEKVNLHSLTHNSTSLTQLSAANTRKTEETGEWPIRPAGEIYNAKPPK
jgi:RNA polymerase sigma-70 factor (ECF subfamily)